MQELLLLLKTISILGQSRDWASIKKSDFIQQLVKFGKSLIDDKNINYEELSHANERIIENGINCIIKIAMIAFVELHGKETVQNALAKADEDMKRELSETKPPQAEEGMIFIIQQFG